MRLLASLTAAAATAVLLAGCATALEPKLDSKPLAGFDLVDPAKVDKAAYEADYAACVQLANQDHADAGRFAAGAASTVAEKATMGLVGSKPAKNADRVSVLKHCLEGRGYKVLR